ncbi:hypothetical protein [Candidatus Absconditicoccus praedator]|uniref:hypothetical protein n=1 Tax=Candidatus Absconditicoccus praedator TaxID=2735562 RepID=UPI001E57A9AA|nr:hypothetical protein [Candidatus Absconditicoccus praedator]UFX83358.1 hypothetical protein HLG78_04485 [Candidatus Absconditicoccus praedator]
MVKFLGLSFAWICSFMIFYISFLFGDDLSEEIVYDFIDQVDDYEFFYDIDFQVDYDISGTFFEKFSSDGDGYSYEFGLNIDLPEEVDDGLIPFDSNMNGTVNFYNNAKIDNFHINIGAGANISGQTAVGGEDQILITFLQDGEEEFREIFDTSDINLDLLFTRFLPYMEIEEGEVLNLSVFSPMSLRSKESMKNNVAIEKKEEGKYSISSGFMGIDYETVVHFEDKNMIKKETPFFSYTKSDGDELDVDNIDQPDDTNDTDDIDDQDQDTQDGSEDDLECKLIGHD